MMERALKERIVGAVILVIFVVLVVPVFLDGPPKEGEIVSERILLPGQEDQAMSTVVLDRERSVPVPAASSEPVKPKTSSSPPATARKSAPEPAQPRTKSEEPAASTTGMWAVQMGSFSNRQNAEKLAATLKKQGYLAFLSQLETDTGQLNRVRIGPQKDRASAEKMAAGLLKVGHKGQVVPHP